jgi:hypothetical protein
LKKVTLRFLQLRIIAQFSCSFENSTIDSTFSHASLFCD